MPKYFYAKKIKFGLKTNVLGSQFRPGHFVYAYYDLRNKKTTTYGKLGKLKENPIIKVSNSATILHCGNFTIKLDYFVIVSF